MTEREKIASRLQVAKINGGAVAASPRGDDRYTVVGRAGDRYTVRALGLERMLCDCRAGQFDRDCRHKAATFLRLVADQTAAR